MLDLTDENKNGKKPKTKQKHTSVNLKHSMHLFDRFFFFVPYIHCASRWFTSYCNSSAACGITIRWKKEICLTKGRKKKQGFWREMTSARSESSRLLIQTTATRTNWCKITVCAHAALWWSIHCSQSCNDLTLFAVGSMWAEKANPKAARSLQSISLRLNVVQKTATTSLEMKRICCSSWACTCRRF